MDTALTNQVSKSLHCPSSGEESPNGHMYADQEKYAPFGRHNVQTLNVSTNSLLRMAALGAGEESPNGHIYTDRERHAALGRHNVQTLNVSTNYLLSMGALGAVTAAAFAGIARTFGDCPLNTVALAGAGATLGVLGTVALAKNITPLEHARHELEQTMADEAYLLENQMDKPGYQCCSNDTLVIRKMANRYQESWLPLWLLWAGIYSPAYKHDQTGLRDDLYLEIRKHGLSNFEITRVGAIIGSASSPADAKEHPDFKRLAEKLKIPNEEKEDLAILLFTLNRFVAEELGFSQDYSIHSFYQFLCKSKYSHYKTRLEQDKSRLEDDVRILSSMEGKPPASV